MQPDYFLHLNSSMLSNLDVWKTYLKWKVINTSSPYLHSKAVNANFAFYGTKLTGTKEQKPRWKTVIGHANNMIGELVAQEYVKIAFTPESKKRVNEMVDNLRESFRDRINKLDWMSDPTKAKAIEKLNSFTRKLGYPDKWTDLTQLKVSRESYIANYFNSSEFWFKYNLNKLGNPVDKDEWEMLPQTVNAYYNPVNNEIVFPAAIMQPPFFDAKADDAVNYGAIGAVIGHEFSHGFDDQGSKYDAQGNLNDWWTAEDRKLFDERTKVLVNQFNQFEVLDSVFVNGELTLGENIADLAGLTVSYDAYMRSLAGKQRTNIDGYTPEQRFFIGFGQVWRGHARPEFLRQQVVTDPHSPAKFRVLGPLSNMPQFYNAFGVKKGDGMWRDESARAKIW
jgi:putative endopeptidase